MNLDTVEYRKELDGNYLLLEAQEQAPFPEKMVLYGKPRYILPFKIEREESRRYSFEISGRESLLAKSRQGALRREEIRQSVRAIYLACEELEAYLLRPGNLILEPGLMFCGREGWAFCLIPGSEEDIMEQMQRLSRFFLSKCDHEEPQTAALCYELFRLMHEPNTSFAQIMELIGTDPAGIGKRKNKKGLWQRIRGLS